MSREAYRVIDGVVIWVLVERTAEAGEPERFAVRFGQGTFGPGNEGEYVTNEKGEPREFDSHQAAEDEGFKAARSHLKGQWG